MFLDKYILVVSSIFTSQTHPKCGSRATFARQLIDMFPSPMTLRIRASIALLPYGFIRLPYEFVQQPCDLNKSQNKHVEILFATLRQFVRRCEFVRQPYETLDLNMLLVLKIKFTAGQTLRIENSVYMYFSTSQPARRLVLYFIEGRIGYCIFYLHCE